MSHAFIVDTDAHYPWSAWLLEHRHGGDETWRQDLIRTRLIPLRDRILERARVGEGDVLLDVGCGDGLIAFGAVERVGDSGTVIFSDISDELLDVCRQQASRRSSDPCLQRCPTASNSRS
jgi:ubiquinone/menaquinone biosynthesis C-methylase UbiE